MFEIREFLGSYIPKNLPLRKKEELYSEIEGHMSDKVDNYKQLGYSLEESIKLAKEDFGNDDSIIREVCNEFEELYAERTVWAVTVAVITIVLNISCIFFDAVITSADYIGDPEALGVTVSCIIVFFELFTAIYARVKNYRKTLIGLGVSNLIIGLSVIYLWYPQSFTFAVGSNFLWLFDILTPFYPGEWYVVYNTVLLSYCFDWLIVFGIAVYCFVFAFKIRRGTAKKLKDPRMTLVIISTVFAVFSVINIAAYPTSYEYMHDYPRWFKDYGQHMTDETEVLFDGISLNEDYNEARDYLIKNGWVSFDDYAESVGRIKRKQFKNNLRNIEMREDYELWFNPNAEINGYGFVGLKKNENGKVEAKLVGDISESMYTSPGFSEKERRECDMDEMLKASEGLHLGDSKENVMNDFVNKYGTVYTKTERLENGNEILYLRVEYRGFVNTEELRNEYVQSHKEKSNMYHELTFTNGKLTEATMHYTAYTSSDIKNKTKAVT